MSVPTVFLVGEDRLPLVPEYLNLGSVVVIAPDRPTLRRWKEEQTEGLPPIDSDPSVGTTVDMAGRRIIHDGASLPLSDLEFRVLGALLGEPQRAWSFRDLRRTAWGDGIEMPVDPYTVKALVQRLRAKLATANAPISIEAVRGYGFRAASPPHSSQHPPTPGTLGSSPGRSNPSACAPKRAQEEMQNRM